MLNLVTCAATVVILAVMWSRLSNRGNAHRGDDGVVDWDVRRHPRAAAELRKIIVDGPR